MDSTAPRPFTIHIPDEWLAAIRARIAGFAWEAMPDAGGWSAGVGLADLRRLADHLLHTYDWRAVEARLNRRPHFVAEIDGQLLHFVHACGDGSRPPLLLLHGWPGSFLEFEALIDPLVADGHDVIVPSLPGYGFSGAPPAPIGPRRMAALCHALIALLYGDRRFLIQGGDVGSLVGGWMAHDRPEAVAALHINMVLDHVADAKPETDEERAWADRSARLAAIETGYAHQQSTRPQTLGVAMADSPLGIAAWILEKFGAWADVPRDADGRPDLWQVFDIDWLVTNIMLYVATDRFVTSTWVYRGRVMEGSSTFPAGSPVRVPTAVAAFPDPVFPPPPASHVAKSYALARYTAMPAGGHFAALERPDLLLADMRAFFSDRA